MISALSENDCGTLQPLSMSSAKLRIQACLPNGHLDATMRASKKIGISEGLPVGVDGDGGTAGSVTAAVIGFFLKSLVSDIHVDGMGWDGMELTRPIDADYPRV